MSFLNILFGCLIWLPLFLFRLFGGLQFKIR